MSAPSNAGRLFVASCISLATTSMVFATRGAITGPITEQSHLSNEQIGLIYGPSLWDFTIAIFICGLLVDLVGMLAVPSIAALAMALTTVCPQTERMQSNVSNAAMVREVFRPLFLLLLCTMFLTASIELGPDQWFGKVMGDISGWKADGILFLCYTAGLMFVLRDFFGGVVHRFSPFAVLTVCSVLAGAGLFWLGALPLPEGGAQAGGTTVAMAFAAATVFGIGKTYVWPTMLGITSEQCPRGGALLMNLMGGCGSFAIAVSLPFMGSRLDKAGPGAAMQSVSALAIILVVIFGSLLLHFRARGGYAPVILAAARPAEPGAIDRQPG